MSMNPGCFSVSKSESFSMENCDLTKKKCVPCEGGVPPLTEKEAKSFLSELKGWALKGKEIVKDFTFENFVEAMAFTNKVGDLAEREGHHPDIFIHQYRNVRISLWTHAVSGLTENDFIVAAKIDEI